MFAAAMCFMPRIVDLGPACLQSLFPAIESLLASVSDCSRFVRLLSLMSQISCLYKGDVFSALVVLGTNAQYRCESIVGPPQVLPVSHTSRDNVTSEAQREAAEAYCSIMLLACNMMSTAPAGSFAQPAAVVMLMKFAGIASAVARHTSDVPCLKQCVILSRRTMEQVPSSPPLLEALAQVCRDDIMTLIKLTFFSAVGRDVDNDCRMYSFTRRIRRI
jgi:hypothetical protein